MARTKKEPKQEVVVTRAEKKDATKNLIKEVLSIQPLKHNDLLEEAAKLYTSRYGEDNVNDVKGRVGSVLDIMKKEGEVANEGGMYALKSRLPVPMPEEKPVKKTAKKTAKKVEETKVDSEVKAEEKPAKKTAKKTVKKAEQPTELTQEKAVEAEEKPVKKNAKKKVAEQVEKTDEKPVKATAKKTVKKTEKAEEKPAEIIPEPVVEAVLETPLVVQEEKTEIQTENKGQPKAEVMDISFLIGGATPAKKEEESTPTLEKKTEENTAKKEEPKPVQKPQPQPQSKPRVQPQNQAQSRVLKTVKKAVQKPQSAEDKLRDNFLKKLRALGGEYFEYYSVYLLEKYSRKNGRRLESMKISGGEKDGGIDGEIELTDRLGFRETIYIQSKNWDPQRGDERLWVVGETLLQQFIGACACKQAKEGRQHTRGIFITTSHFTPDAKRILEDMSDKVVGYDGDDVFDAAKECQFGLLYENGNWKLDEKLLSGTKAFFNMI